MNTNKFLGFYFTRLTIVFLFGILTNLGSALHAQSSNGDQPTPDRERVENLIIEHPDFHKRKTEILFHREGYQEALQQGLFRPQGAWELTPAHHVASVISGGRPGGKLMFLTNAAASTVQIKVDITGVRANGFGEALAEFTWRYTELPAEIADFARQGSHGTAKLLKYDDGWKVNTVSMAISDKPYPPSDAKLARLSAVDQRKQETVLSLLGGMKETRNGAHRYLYGVEGKWFEFAQGTTTVVLVVQDFDTTSGFMRVFLAPVRSTGPNVRAMRILPSRVGVLEGRMDMSDFTMSFDYSAAAGNFPSPIKPSGPILVGGLVLSPNFDDAGNILGWQTRSPDQFGNINGHFEITTRKRTN